MGGRVVYIPTPPMPIVMSVEPWATSSLPRAPNWAGPGSGLGGTPMTCGHEYSSIHGALEPEIFFVLSI